MNLKTLKEDPWRANRFETKMRGIHKKTRRSVSGDLRGIPGRISRKTKKALKNNMYAMSFLQNAFAEVLDSMDAR